MKRLSQDIMVKTIKRLREEKGFTQEQLGKNTGINRQMIGRIENSEYIPSILQLERIAEILEFEISDLFIENEPVVYTAFRKSSMSQEDRDGVDHMFDMILASKQQLLLRKAMLDEQE